MAQPRQTSAWPASGERQVKCSIQEARPTTDTLGGRGEPTWTTFGEWWAKVTVVPIVPNETDAVLIYEVEGPFRKDLLQRFNTGIGVRLVTTNLEVNLTLKVFQVENPLLKNRTLVCHCANAVNTQ